MLKVSEQSSAGEQFPLAAASPDCGGRSSSLAQQLTSRLLDLLESAERALPRADSVARAHIRAAASLLRGRYAVAPPTSHSARGFRGGMARWQILRVKRYVEENLTCRMTVADIAAQTGLHRSHFSRVFRSVTGESPHSYLVRQRIERAQELMLATERTLSQIALDSGMADQAHLTRLFRRHLGETPGCWRRRQKHLQRVTATSRSVPRSPRTRESGDTGQKSADSEVHATGSGTLRPAATWYRA